MLRLASHLPHAAVGLAPVLERALDLAAQDRPHPVVEPVGRRRVDVDRFEHRAPQVVLALGVGGVADPDRPRSVVSGQVIERDLGDLILTADAVEDLQLGVALGQVGDEVEVVVGLPVEAQAEQTPERERRVADPAEAVVVVAHASWRLGQRRGRRGHECAGRREGQPLEREGTALEVAAPRMIREAAPRQPVLPVVGRPDEPLVGLLERVGRFVLGPREGAEVLIALADERASAGPSALEAEIEVGRQPQMEIDPRRRRLALVVAPVRVLPARPGPARSQAWARSPTSSGPRR